MGQFLVERGAVLVDGDSVARQVVEPGKPALAALVERFGDSIRGSGGHLDRGALAALAFADDDARRDLNRITHPAIREEMLRQVAAVGARDPDAVVVLDIPLLAEGGRARYPVAGVLVVDTPVDLAIQRLMATRGFTEQDARARAAAQASREDRRAISDLVIDNSGDLHHLRSEVERAWAWIQALVVTPGS